jgi:hypothetical protein
MTLLQSQKVRGHPCERTIGIGFGPLPVTDEMDWNAVDLDAMVLELVDLTLGCPPVEPVFPIIHEILEVAGAQAVELAFVIEVGGPAQLLTGAEPGPVDLLVIGVILSASSATTRMQHPLTWPKIPSARVAKNLLR